ncbi:hypothetical protein BH09BAC3_BH09BAC3_05780 [soil metagenome]
MRKVILFVLIGMTAGLMNCSTDMKVCVKEVSAATIAAVPQAQLNTDIARIKTYTTAIAATNVVEDPSGLRYKITSIGSGDTPCLSSIVTVAYSGKVLVAPNNNTLTTVPFDSNTSVSFNLSDLILGWQIAFPKFPAGTQVTLYIPSGLAYGARVQTGIPANSVLVFEINLISFQ